MAFYRVVSWRDIPALVEAFDDGECVQVPLSQRFQDLIDAAAMRAGESGSEAYLEGWAKGPKIERPGSPQAVGAEVAQELEAGFEALVLSRLGPSAG
jgi:cvfA/B/C family virulence factor